MPARGSGTQCKWLQYTLVPPPALAALSCSLTSLPMQRCGPILSAHLWWMLILQALQRSPCLAFVPVKSVEMISLDQINSFHTFNKWPERTDGEVSCSRVNIDRILRLAYLFFIYIAFICIFFTASPFQAFLPQGLSKAIAAFRYILDYVLLYDSLISDVSANPFALLKGLGVRAMHGCRSHWRSNQSLELPRGARPSVEGQFLWVRGTSRGVWEG